MINKNLNINSINYDYLNSNPNYAIIDDLFDVDLIKKCESEFIKMEDSDFFRYSDPQFEYEKYSLNNVDKMPTNLRSVFNYIHSSDFLKFVEKVTSFDKLFIDEKRWGGGLHMTKPGGYLSIHKDFNVLPDSYKNENQLLRCINLIGYITDEDQSNNDGYLEFWNNDYVVKIENKFNRWILFDTRDNFHGHPYPFKGQKPRMSIASYYYIETKVEEKFWKSTDYLRLPWMEDSPEYMQKRKDRSNPKLRYEKIYKETR